MIKAMPTNLLTIDEATRALGVSRSTLWRRLQHGDLPSVRRGGRRLVRLTATRKAARRRATAEIQPFTESHPIFRLMGAGRSGGRPPGAREKHAILDA
jgi:excisionase family DNA binding protein